MRGEEEEFEGEEESVGTESLTIRFSMNLEFSNTRQRTVKT